MILEAGGSVDFRWTIFYSARFNSEGNIDPTFDSETAVTIVCSGGDSADEGCEIGEGVLACIQGNVIAPIFTEPFEGCHSSLSQVEDRTVIEGVDLASLSTLYREVKELTDGVFGLVQPLAFADVRLPRSFCEVSNETC